MKAIAIVVEHYYPFVSGVPVVMQYMAEGLVNEGYDVSVHTGAYIHGSELPTQDVVNGVRVYRYFLESTLLYTIRGDKNEKRRFISNLSSVDIDCIIISCSQCWSTNLLLPYLKKIETKKIFYPHGYSGLKFTMGVGEKLSFRSLIAKVYRYLWMKMYYIYLPRYLQRFDALIYISNNDSAKRYGDSHGIKHFTIIENATEDCFFIKEPPQNTEQPYITCIANYTAVKNQEDLLRAFYIAKTEEYSLVLVGRSRNKYSDRLEKLREQYCMQYGNKNVQILWDLSRAEIHDVVSGASIYIMSSKWEEYSISLCEAMAERVPFISTDVGNARYLPGGVIVKSVEEMAHAITRLVSDREYALKLGLEGYQYARHHNSRSVAVKRLSELIKQVTSQEKKLG